MSQQRSISFRLNGVPVTASVEPHHNLIELLQTQFGLTGARESCGQGLCGCCTALVNGRAVSGCLYLASFVDGTDQQIAHYLSGNLCRCAAYPEIIAAVKLAAQKRKAGTALAGDKP